MDFKFPDVGEGITEGKLVSWHVKLGEYVKKEQTIASVETDKAVVDIPSPVSGTVEKLNGKEGEVIFVGNTLAIINDGSQISNSSNNKENTNNTKASQSNSSNYQIPQTKQDYSVSQNEIKQSSYQSKSEYQNFNSNISNSSNQILAMPIVRRASKIKGINLSNIPGSGNHNQILLSDLKLKLSDVIDVKFDRISDSSKSFSLNSQNVSENISNQSSQNTAFNSKDYSSILATPSTKKLARELDVDLTQIKGTGENGSITREDVLNASKNIQSNKISSPSSPKIEAQPTTIITQSSLYKISTTSSINGEKSNNNFGQIEILKFSPTRNAIYRHMIESKNNTTAFTISDEIDITDLYNFREKQKEFYEKQGVKLTYLPFIIKSVIDALIKHPVVNSSVNDSNKEIVMKKYYNIGIATDTIEGLVVPVIKNCDNKSIISIAKEIFDVTNRARDHKLNLEDMNGGTFTITSLGNSFGQSFTPVINYPESAILGIGRIIEKPVVLNGNIIPRKIVTMSLTCDHRIIDGAEASRFMNDVKFNVENFEILLLK